MELNANITEVRPYVYLKAAKKACSANVDNIKTIFPQLEDYDVPYLCMDLVYEYILLVEGFGAYIYMPLSIYTYTRHFRKNNSSFQILVYPTTLWFFHLISKVEGQTQFGQTSWICR